MSVENNTHHRTSDGRRIPLHDLADDHLLNILPKLRFDNRRHVYEAEARRRGLIDEQGNRRDPGRFELGRLFATPGAREALAEARQDASHFIARRLPGGEPTSGRRGARRVPASSRTL
jgi:hypothetical protein